MTSRTTWLQLPCQRTISQIQVISVNTTEVKETHMNVILAIHPKWAEKIFSGEKTIEFRKSFPQIYYPRMKIFLYETVAVHRVTGYFLWAGTKRFQDVDWTKADERQRKILEEGCIAAEDLNAYQEPRKHLCAWGVERPKKFDTPKTLQNFGIDTAPQSWVYTKFDFDDISKQLVEHN